MGPRQLVPKRVKHTATISVSLMGRAETRRRRRPGSRAVRGAPKVHGSRIRTMTAGKHFSSMVGAAGLAFGVLAGSLSGSIGNARAQSQDERFSTSPRPPGLIPGGSFKLFGAQPAPGAPPTKDDWSGEAGSPGPPPQPGDPIRAS